MRVTFLLLFAVFFLGTLDVNAEESHIEGGVDVGDMTIRAASYKVSNYDEYKNTHPNGDPEALGFPYLPQRIRFSMAGSELVMKFRKLRLRNCHTGFWKDGFEAKNVELFAKAAKERTSLILHNVTVNKKGECFFESFSLGVPIESFR